MEGGSSRSPSRLRVKQIRKKEQDKVISELKANQQKVNQVLGKLESLKKSIHYENFEENHELIGIKTIQKPYNTKQSAFVKPLFMN